MAITTSELIEPTETAISGLWEVTQQYIPNILGAILVLLVGIPISGFISKVVKKILTKAKLDDWAKKSGVEKALFQTSFTNLISTSVKWILLLMFFTQASTTLGMEALSNFLVGFLMAIPNIIIGALILVISLTLGTFFEKAIKQKSFAFSEIIGAGIYCITVYFGIVLALPQFGITNTEVLVTGFNYVIGGISLGIAIALGLGVGLAIKDPVEKLIVKRTRKK